MARGLEQVNVLSVMRLSITASHADHVVGNVNMSPRVATKARHLDAVLVTDD
jgi:hypothetical protein